MGHLFLVHAEFEAAEAEALQESHHVPGASVTGFSISEQPHSDISLAVQTARGEEHTRRREGCRPGRPALCDRNAPDMPCI